MCTNPSQPIYSPWFPRQGDNLRATVELVANASSANITVTVLTKKSEETTNGTAIGSTFGSSGGTLGRYVGEFTPTDGINELVRYKFDPGTTGSGWVLFRMLAPVWFDSAK
jgi:hypothetical protein